MNTNLTEQRNPPLPGYASSLARDLRRAVAGDVDFGPQARVLYAYDASVFRQVPIGVVVPRDAGDVAAALAACREHGAPASCAPSAGPGRRAAPRSARDTWPV